MTIKAVILPLCLAFAIVSCQEPEIEIPRHITAATEGFDQTRTSLGEGNHVLWSAEDVIAVFADRQTPDRYQVLPSSVGKSSADFYHMEASRSKVRLGATVAVYPFVTDITCTSETAGEYILEGLSVPSVQSYAENSFANKAFLMAAVAEVGTNTFAFKNVCGVLKIDLKGNSLIKSLTLKGNGEEPLSGPAMITLDMDGRVPSVQMDEEAGKEIMLDCGDGVRLSEDHATSFMFSLPPVDFPRGFTVKIKADDGGEMMLRTDKHNPVRRSGVLNMPEVYFEPFYVPVPDVSIKPVYVGFDDIVIRVDVGNVLQFAGGYKLKKDFSIAGVVREANWKTAPRITDRFSYEGPLTSFPTGTPGPSLSAGQTYVVWVAPYAESVKSVTAEDIVYEEFTVPEIQAGGSVDVSAVDCLAGLKSMEITLSAPDASVIYAMLLKKKEYSGLTSEKDKVDYLIKNSTPVAGTEMKVERTGFNPGESVYLLAIAIDEDGRYGAVLNEEYTTEVPVFNDDIVINMDVTYEDKTAKVAVTASGAGIAGYYYFYGKTSSSSWTRVLGGSRESAEEYLAVNNDNYLISNSDEDPLTDGNIVIDGLEMDVEHVVVVMAYDVDGRLSRAAMRKFTPQLYLGDFVYKTGATKALWQESRPQVTFGNCLEDGEFYMINWAVTPAEGMTAYAVCTHPNAMEGYSDPKAMAIRIFNMGDVVVPGKMINMLYGDKDNLVYVIWKDSDGNFYEAYSIKVPQS